jgi:hypothetical protein
MTSTLAPFRFEAFLQDSLPGMTPHLKPNRKIRGRCLYFAFALSLQRYRGCE